jgi:ribosome maturation factor RimP
MTDTREQRIADLVAPIAEGVGADLESVGLRRAGRRTVVVITVDADGGISLDDVATLSQRISVAMDEGDVMGQAPYTLEVTSPGVHRPLTLPRHWRRAATRLVKVTMHDGRQVLGRVVRSDDTAAVLSVDGAERSVPYTEVAKAVVQVEFPKEGR